MYGCCGRKRFHAVLQCRTVGSIYALQYSPAYIVAFPAHVILCVRSVSEFLDLMDRCSSCYRLYDAQFHIESAACREYFP